MAVLSDISSVLTLEFAPDTTRNSNRKAAMLRFLRIEKGFGYATTWAAEFTGAETNAGPAADGADAPTDTFDTKVPAQLGWGIYENSVKQSGLALSAAASTMSPKDLRDLLGRDIENAANALASKTNKDFWTQASNAGGKLPVTAVDSAIAATGTYAAINRATYSLWGAVVSLNGGTKRALTLKLMRDLRRQIFVNGGETDLIVCDPITFDYYGALMDSNRRYVDQVRTAKGLITLDAGFRALEFEGVPLVRDKDCPAGNMYFLDTKQIYWKYLPDVTVPGFPILSERIAKGDDKEPGSLPVSVIALAKTGDANKLMLKTYPQIICERPNVMGQLGDLLTS